MSSPSALIIGARSTIGRALVARAAGSGGICYGTVRHAPAGGPRLHLDLAADPATWELPDRVDLAFLMAGMTSVDACAADPDAARRVNVDATLALAKRLVDRGAHVVFPSTDRVFDGAEPYRKPDDHTCPATTYGLLKADAERQLVRLGATVLRLGKVIGPEDRRIAAWRGATDSVEAFGDAHVAPISLDLAVDALWRLGRARAGGIHQLAARDQVSYADLARRVVRVGVRVVETTAPAGLFPAHVTLNCASLMRLTGLVPPAALAAVSALPRAA